MDASYNNNKLLLEAIDVLLHHYRDIFKLRWKLLCDYNWTDTEQDAITFMVLFDKKIKLNKTQKQVFGSGNTNSWDLSLLKLLLKELKGDGARAQLEDTVLTRVGDVRNQLSHSTGGIKKEEFNNMWKELEQCLRDLGRNIAPLQQILASKHVAPKQAESKEMIALKETGNVHLQKGNLSEAIACYTQALKLPGLTSMQQSVLLCNRAHAHTLLATKAPSSQQREEEFDFASVDAKMAKSLSPSWARPYFRMGKIMHMRKKYAKAIENFNVSLAIDPNYQEAKDAKAESTSELGRFTRGESMEPNFRLRHENMRNDGQITHSDAQISEVMKLAENMGTKEAYVMKGHAYRDGILGYSQDFAKAKSLYTTAAEMGSVEAMHNLGVFYANGYSGNIDLKSAVHWWHKVASHTYNPSKTYENVGIPEAENALGLAYLDGLGVEKDENKAVSFFERSAHHGNAGAYNNLGNLYEYGGCSIVKNSDQARLYYRAASMKGDTNAMVNLGLLEMREMNLDIGKKWICRAAEKGNFLAQQQVEKLKLHDMPTEAMDPEIKDLLLRTQKMFAAPSSPISSVTKEKYPLEELFRYSKKSAVAARMLEAKVHSIEALLILSEAGEGILDNLEKMKLFAHHAGLCYRITEIVFSSVPLCLKVFKRLLEKDPNNTDAMLGFILSSSDLHENLAYMKGWIAKGITFPRLYEIQGSTLMFMRREKEALVAFYKALEEASPNFGVYYDLATAKRLLEDPASISDYDMFLKHADPDDRKVPNAYFGKAMVFLQLGNMASAEECYKIGCDKAKSALPIFKLEATLQESTGQILQMQKIQHRMRKGEKIGSSELFPMSPSKTKPEEDTKYKKFHDLRRIEMVVRQREAKHVERQAQKMTGYGVQSTTPPLKQQPPISSFANLKYLCFEDIDLQKDAVYKGCIISCTILGPFSVLTGAYTLVEDDKGDIERLGLYNFGFKNDHQFEANFWVGKKISIINPYLRIGMDDKPFVRVDDPATVISHTAIRKNVCALCLSEEHLQKCAKCNTFYCSKKCQEMDWKTFKHKFICN